MSIIKTTARKIRGGESTQQGERKCQTQKPLTATQ